MATPHEDFDTPAGTESESSGTFTLGGRVWKIRHRDDVPFETVQRLMGQSELGEDASDTEKAERAREVVLQTGPFFADTIVPEQVDDFMVLLRQPNSPVTLGKLRGLMEYISSVVFSEEGDARPTQPSPSRQPGRRATGNTSRAASSSRGTRQKASAG